MYFVMRVCVFRIRALNKRKLAIFVIHQKVLMVHVDLFVFFVEKGSDHIVRFKSWLWSIVERMSNREKQDLLYFWTSSPSMPANPDSYQPPPSITIRPADDQHLPTSNTCISRLYIPLYSSKALLRSKLLASIKIKAFGFI